MVDTSFNAFALKNCYYLQINKNVQLALSKWILVHNDQASFEKLFFVNFLSYSDYQSIIGNSFYFVSATQVFLFSQV